MNRINPTPSAVPAHDTAEPKPGRLLAAMQAIQERDHYLSAAALAELSTRHGQPLADLTSVATFYNAFRFAPAGRHAIRICIGTACHVKGAEALTEAFRRHLRIPADGDTDPDGCFSIEQVACLGCCMLAPAIQIDQTIYGPVTPANLASILRDFLASSTTDPPAAAPHPDGAHAGEIRLCTCSSCLAVQAGRLRDHLRMRIRDWHLPATLREVGCTGASHQAPLLELVSRGQRFRYGRVQPRDLDAILTEHFRRQRPLPVRLRAAGAALLDRLIETDPSHDPPTRFTLSIRDQPDAGFWRCQTRLATEQAGERAPLDFSQYLDHGGFAQLRRCLEASDASACREQIISTLQAAGLRGRGGAGYPTAAKWAALAQRPAAPGEVRYAICNGDEGDPGAFMDRMLLESFPLRILEGLAIAAWTIGAVEAVFYIRREYPVAVARIREAIRLCEARGLLRRGDRVGDGTQARAVGGYGSLRIRVIEGSGAFVCGEETALIASIEDERGIPRHRPPYPAEQGLEGRPTVINNVETLALVPWILAHGAEAFRQQGSASSPGTKTFALAGRVKHGGLIEVPMGMTIRSIVMDAGGGIPDGHTFKAVQVGGPSGGCLPAALADTPVDYEALNAAGAMMGSGGLVVLDERDCMVDIARYFLQFTQRESCGRCTPCRIGTHRMLGILDRLCEGRAHPDDLNRLEQLALGVAADSQCGLGRSAPNPVLTAMRYFRDEFDAHIRGVCPARKCRALIRYSVADTCIGCTRCSQQCPAEAIPFTPHERAGIDQARCTRCDGCRQVCPVNAIVVTSG